jgi:uncharacterized protein (TIGR00661 family)
MKKKVLVCPLNWGLGHATRCVPIIREQLAAGNEVVICADGYPLEFLRQEFPALRTIELPSYPIRYSKGKSQVFAMLRFLPTLLKGIYRENRWLKELLRREHFDVIISDNRFGLWNRDIHSIYITHQVMVKMPKGLKWLEPIGYILHKYIINKYNECLIPDFAEDGGLSGDLSHKYALPANAKFIGTLSRFNDCKLTAADASYQVVAVLSGVEPQRTLFEKELIAVCKNSDKKTLIVQGKPGSEPFRVEITGNLTVVPYMNTSELAAVLMGCEEIISRSGYTTIMDLNALNCLNKARLIPTPGQTEQEYLAGYLQSKGYNKN